MSDHLWFTRELSPAEFAVFVAEAMTGTKGVQPKAFVGTVTPEAGRRIEAVCGVTVTKIMADSGAVRHAYKKAEHNLLENDLLLMREVVNAATDIHLSLVQHQNNICIEMSKDEAGILVFVFEARQNFGGWLALVTAYRQSLGKKVEAGRHSDAAKAPRSPRPKRFAHFPLT